MNSFEASSAPLLNKEEFSGIDYVDPMAMGVVEKCYSKTPFLLESVQAMCILDLDYDYEQRSAGAHLSECDLLAGNFELEEGGLSSVQLRRYEGGLHTANFYIHDYERETQGRMLKGSAVHEVAEDGRKATIIVHPSGEKLELSDEERKLVRIDILQRLSQAKGFIE